MSSPLALNPQLAAQLQQEEELRHARQANKAAINRMIVEFASRLYAQGVANYETALTESVLQSLAAEAQHRAAIFAEQFALIPSASLFMEEMEERREQAQAVLEQVLARREEIEAQLEKEAEEAEEEETDIVLP